MTRYSKRKLKYSLNENFNLLPYVEWGRFVTLAGNKSELRVTLSYLHLPQSFWGPLAAPRPPAVNITSLREVGDSLRQSINSPTTFIFSPTTQKFNDIPADHFTHASEF